VNSPKKGAKEVIKVRLLRAGKVIRTYRLRRDTVTIGAEKGCTIRAAGDTSLAPKHATIYVEDDELSLVPEPGAEVLVNGESVDYALPNPEDVIKIGRLTFRVELADSMESIAPPPQVEKRKSGELPKPVLRPEALKEKKIEKEKAAAKEEIVKEEAVKKEIVEGKVVKEEPVKEIRDLEEEDFDEDLFFEEEEEDELSFTEPFDLANMLLKKKEPDREGPKEPYAAAHVTRVVNGRVAQTFCVSPSKPYVSVSGELECRIKGKSLFFAAGQGLTGEVRINGKDEDLLAVQVQGNARSAVLSEGDSALLEGDDGIYRIEVYRPPLASRAGTMSLSPRFLAIIALAVVVHATVGFAVTYMQPKAKSQEQNKEKEVFAVVKMENKGTETPPESVKQQEAPKDTLTMSEKAPAVSNRTIKRIRDREKASQGSSVSSLLQVLSRGSGKPGETNNLKDLISNIDAVASSNGAGAPFSIAGAIASLPGEGVNIAKKGGGGFISTLSGEEVAGKGSNVATLSAGKKSGKVRGKVTKMTSGLKVQGKLSREDVTRVINAHFNAIQACYERALMSDPGLNGRIVFDWTVTTTGAVKGVRVRSSTLGNPKVADCISSLIKGWKFPKPEGGEVVITYPFLFRSVSS
jgi:hypothetical protein